MSFAEKIEKASHIVLYVSSEIDSIAAGSAFYTYLMRLHKKVTFYTPKNNLPKNLSFLPWFEKIKTTFPSSCDFVIGFGSWHQDEHAFTIESANIDNHPKHELYAAYNLVDLNCVSITQVVFDFFNTQDVKLNPKMATSLYAGLLAGSRNFTKEGVDGTTFAFAQALIQQGAEHRKCMQEVVFSRTLAVLRLKSLMLREMRLFIDARVACFCVDHVDLLSSGADKSACQEVVFEALYLPTVKYTLLIVEAEDRSLEIRLGSRETIDFTIALDATTMQREAKETVWHVDAGADMGILKMKIIKLLEKEI